MHIHYDIFPLHLKVKHTFSIIRQAHLLSNGMFIVGLFLYKNEFWLCLQQVNCLLKDVTDV